MIKTIVTLIAGFLAGTIFGATVIRMLMERLVG